MLVLYVSDASGIIMFSLLYAFGASIGTQCWLSPLYKESVNLFVNTSIHQSIIIHHLFYSSQAVFSYLTRASASFNTLVQFHKELKNSKFDHIESTNNENPVKYEHKSEENKVGLTVKGSVGSHSARKRHKQNRKKNDSFVIEQVGEVVDSA
ncbi:unnamed protein product [Camellia sinensis]